MQVLPTDTPGNANIPVTSSELPARHSTSVLHAMSMLAASWFVTLLIGLVSSKVLAVILGPGGFGYLGLLQNFVELVAMFAGLGIGTALVRSGADRINHNDQQGISSLRQAAWLIFAVTGALTMVVLSLFRKRLSVVVLGGGDHQLAIVLMAVAVLFTQASYIQVNTLNAYHRVKALAKWGAWSKLFGALLTLGCVLVWREAGVVPAVIAAAIAGWLASQHYLFKELGPLPSHASRREVLSSARSLLEFGVPFVSSAAFSRGVQLFLPIVVLHLLNAESVGNFRAAGMIAMTYLGFLVTAMAQDYFPRVSANARDAQALNRLINEQQRLVMLLSMPLVLGTIALAPYFIALFYSSKFTLAVDLLQWLLIADLFRLSSWTMVHVIVARCGSGTFFLTEAVYGTTTLGACWVGARWLGLTGVGMAFLATYIIYSLMVWIIVRREIHLKLSRQNVQITTAAIVTAIFIRILPFTRFARLRTPVALVLAAIACAWSISELWPELRGMASGGSASGLLCRLAQPRAAGMAEPSTVENDLSGEV